MTPPRKDDENRINIEGLRPSDVAMLKAVATETTQQAVIDTLVQMGLDPSRPFEAQKDFMFLRSSRERCEGVVGKVAIAVVGILATGGLAAFWMGFKAALK